MNLEDARKLLGGYATGTLTPEEQRALFEAALEDQELFDDLAREQSLRDLLSDPVARGTLLAALDEPRPEPWYRKRWLMTAVVAGLPACAMIVALIAPRFLTRRAPEVVTMAKLEPPPPAPSLPSAETDSSRPAPPTVRDALRRPDLPPRAAPPPARQVAADSGRADQSPAPGIRDNRAESEERELKKEAVVAEAPKLTVATGERSAVGGAIAPARVQSAPPAPPAPALQGAQALFFGASQSGQLADTAELAKAGGPSQARAQQEQLRVVSAGTAASLVPANIGVSYNVLRRTPDGAYAPVPELERGDTAAIRLVPNARGHLTVTALGEGSSRVLLSVEAAPMASYQTPDLRPGETRASVVFTRPAQSVRATAASNLVETSGDRTFVVSAPSTPPAPEVSFVITLKYK